MKVSVIIPVYNPGPCLDSCLESLLGQSMSPGEYEVLFVDDGSDDGTPVRLDRLAEQHSHIRVIHAARTGGPGRPRNIGVEVSNGEYVYFLDPDDWLAPLALERMYAMAIRNSADIVIGKLVGHGGRGVPKSLFRESREPADLLKDNLFSFLTPHKLFRTAFLLRHQLRFAEGPVWLEDHRLVVEAYFRAKVICVLADEVCCHWVKRESRAHYSARKFDARDYYRSLRAVLDIVDAHTEPGEERDQIYAHWYHGKMIRLLGGRSFLGVPVRRSRYQMYREVRRLARERFAPAVDRWLPLSMRVRAQLLRSGAYADITRLARAEQRITVVPTLERVDWDEDALVVRVSARLCYADGRPVAFRRVGARLRWEPPVQLRTKLPRETLDATELIADSRLDLYVQNRDDAGDYRLPTNSHLVPETVGDTERIVLQSTARLDARTAKLGRPLEAGTWDCFVRLESCGWGVQRRLGRPSLYETAAPCASRTLGTAGELLVEPYWTNAGNLSIRVKRSAPTEARRL
ncbi:glycosyltransferase family 2 protein [Actinopolymorpha alba]|uniref:glycosyltransferase family 2 protein n=1 Tax=Actinopolymorpha alba TaxID=533267 RepID=UPI0003A73D25|nr:glycosyltransferase family 2 protein [Actinopolymorpha alba]